MSKNIIFITGANGEIGQHLIKTLNSKGMNNIVALDLHPSQYDFSIQEFIQGSILDNKLLDYVNNKYCIESIYHFAAILSTKAEINPQLGNEVNIYGTKNILEICNMQAEKQKKIIPFFFPSSIAVYNVLKHKNNIINESADCDIPITQYGKAKLECEKLGFKYLDNIKGYGVDFRAIRFPGIISATSLPSGGTSDFAPEMIHYAAKNIKYNCYAKKESQLPFIVMPDAISAIFKIMSIEKKQLKSNIYNLTSFSPTVNDFFNKTKSYFPNFKMTYNIDIQRQNIIDSWPAFINDEKARKDWGWEPTYDFDLAYKQYIIPEINKKYRLEKYE